MNKNELIAAVADRANLTKKDTEAFISAFTDVIADELVNDRKVQMVGFGTFEVTRRNARIGRNPKTGESVSIPESKAPKFRPAAALKTTVNQ